MIKTEARQLDGSEEIAIGSSGVDTDLARGDEWRDKRGMAEDDSFAVIPFIGEERFPHLAEIRDILLAKGLFKAETGMDEDILVCFPVGQERSKEITVFSGHEGKIAELSKAGAAVTCQGFFHAQSPQIGEQGRILAAVVLEKQILMITHEGLQLHTLSAQSAKLVEHPLDIGPTIQIVTQTDQGVAAGIEGNPLQQEPEFIRTTMDIANGKNFFIHHPRVLPPT